MIRCCKGALRLGVLAAAMLMVLPQSFAQNCRVFEREMETLFMNHEPQSPVPRQELERIRARCPEPSRKMLLIYYFFRAVDAYQSTNLSDREAYDRAVTYYNRAAENFQHLTEYELEDPFFQTFYDRAAEFEDAIQDLAYETGVNSRTYSYNRPTSIQGTYNPAGSRMASVSRGASGTNTRTASRQDAGMEVEWNRENVILPARSDIEATRSNAREGSRRQQEWDMTYSETARTTTRGATTSTNTRSMGPSRGIDTYAGVELVGSLSTIDPMSYLRYSRSPESTANDLNLRRGVARDGSTSTPNPNELWSYSFTDPQGSGSTSANARTRGADNTATFVSETVTVQPDIFVNVGNGLSLTNRPGKSSPEIARLGYGEAVYRVANVSPSFQQGEQYVQVQTINGQVGWVPQSMLVMDGRLAVVVNTVNGITNDARQVTFFPAEPIVLARYENGRALVVGMNGEKSGWIADLSALSISEEDLQIASMIAEAMGYTSIYARQAKLLEIQRHPAYFQSPLSAVVDRLVAEEAQRR